MIQLLASNNSIQFMLNKMEISMKTISIRKEKRLQSILCLMRMLIQIRQRRFFYNNEFESKLKQFAVQFRGKWINLCQSI